MRVKSCVTTPKYKWGSVNHRSVGIVSRISPNGRDVTVDFPMQSNWTGLISGKDGFIDYILCYYIYDLFILIFNYRRIYFLMIYETICVFKIIGT